MKAFLSGMAGALIVLAAGTAGFAVRGQIAGTARAAAVAPPAAPLYMPPPATPASSIEIQSADGKILVVDKADNRIWRYYRNTDEKGKPTDEGFVQLGFVNLWPTPDDEPPPQKVPSKAYDEPAVATVAADLPGGARVERALPVASPQQSPPRRH